MKLGVMGLPNVGKSTLFNAITKAGAEAANYPFCTIEPNTGVVAVPDERLDKLEAKLADNGYVLPEPQLGISVSQIGEVLEGGLSGLLVQQVVEGGAADRAGIQVGDYVITADGETLTSSGDLLRVRRRFEIGDRLELTVWRAGELLEVTLELLEAVPEA